MAIDSQRPLELIFLPYTSAPGHAIPLFDLARLFAARGERVTFVTTPPSASKYQKTIDNDTSSGRHNITLHIVHLPLKEAGLPEDFDELSQHNDLGLAQKSFQAFLLLRKPIEEFMDALHPDCIISDSFYMWTTDAAARLGIPRIVFSPYSLFSLCLKDAFLRPDSPHLKVQSDYEPFLIPGLPDPITMTRAQLPSGGYTQLMKQFREIEMKSYGVLINSFYALDSAYIDHYKKVMGHQVFPIGPASLLHQNGDNSAVVVSSRHECLSWLDSREPNSVLFVCFGSWMKFTDEQLMELGCALESAGHQFIWAILGKDAEEKEEDAEEKWLPKGFYGNIKGRGLVVKGWVPQPVILEHPSVGGFMTHCGWNSVTEAVSGGVPLVTCPFLSDQFYNEKFVTQVLGIGVEVGSEDWNMWYDVGKKVIPRESFEKAVRKLMAGGDEAEEMRRKVKELRHKAKRAVEEGGSSQVSLTVLIENLKKLRDDRKADN